MAYDRAKQERDNTQHRNNPEPGDYWNDIFAPVCVVLAVTDKLVTICAKTKDVGKERWTWDLYAKETMSRADFAKKYLYSSLSGGSSASLEGKTWCDVCPRSHIEFVGETP